MANEAWRAEEGHLDDWPQLFLNGECLNIDSDLADMLNADHQRVKAQEEALRKYGRHSADCTPRGSPVTWECYCGLSQFLPSPEPSALSVTPPEA